MTDTPFIAKNGIVANGGFTENSTLVSIGSVSLNTSAVIVGSNYTNSTNFTGTSNNTNYFNGQLASFYQTAGGLESNVATLTANNTWWAANGYTDG